MKLFVTVAVSACLTVVAGCGDPAANKPINGPVGVQPSVDALQGILAKNESFGLKKFPVGFWNYLHLSRPEHAARITEQEVQDWADVGATVMIGPGFNPDNPAQHALMSKLMDWAAQREMKLILADGRFGGSRRQEAIDDFARHPAYFGYQAADEPNGKGARALFEAIGRQQAAVSDVPVRPFINLGPSQPGNEGFIGVEKYSDYVDGAAGVGKVDFLSFDCYYQMNPGQGGWDIYYTNLREMREGGQRHGVPFWATLLSVGHFHYRVPSYDDLRWQFNTAVASGAQGVLYFFYYMRDPHGNYRFPPVDAFWEKTQTYDNLRVVHRAFHTRYGDLFLRLAPTRVTFFPEPYGGGEAFTPNEVLKEIKPWDGHGELVIGEFVDAKGQRYVMAVNNSTTENLYVVLTFQGKDVKLYTRDWQGHEREGLDQACHIRGWRDGYFKAGYWLAPGQEIFQRVDSEMVRTSAISTGIRQAFAQGKPTRTTEPADERQ
ncbi:MAG: hypothetical protein ACYS8X_12780 [Planctomycetota bacterium]|jgi:hypothetical protein